MARQKSGKAKPKNDGKAQKKSTKAPATIPEQAPVAIEPKPTGRVEVKYEGKTYQSRSDAAKAMIADGKSLSEAAKLSGMTYQTVYAVTKGAEKVAQRRIKYRAVKLGNSGRYSEGMLAEKLNIPAGQVRKMMNENGISLPTKADLDKAAKEAAEAKAKKAEEKKEAARIAREQAKAEKEAAKAEEAKAAKAEEAEAESTDK